MVRAGEIGAGGRQLGRADRTRRFTVTCAGLTWLGVAVGVIFRFLDYVHDRRLYMDERSLLENLVGSRSSTSTRS